jgi:cell wall-associated NlpC family hydrolase
MAGFKRYTQEVIDKAVAAAMRAAEAHRAGTSKFLVTYHSPTGAKTYTVTMDLDTGGYCNRFVRQVYEQVLGLAPKAWRFRGDKAVDTCHLLAAAGLELPAGAKLQPGDILGWPDRCLPWGHIGIYVGAWFGDGRKLVAENTTSDKRGCPVREGTKYTQLVNMPKGRHVYRLGPTV